MPQSLVSSLTFSQQIMLMNPVVAEISIGVEVGRQSI